MTRLFGFKFALISTFGLIISPHSLWAEDCISVGKIESVIGHAEVRLAEEFMWEPAKSSQTLCALSQLRTGESSKVAIKLKNATLINLSSNTTLNLTNVESESKSFLDLIEGIIHTLSRVPRSLEIRTPYVNAFIEGTEFVVAQSDYQTEVSVLEGLVRTYNPLGEVLLSNNEASITVAGKAPEKRININPKDAVSWVLTYPPLLDFTQEQSNPVEQQAYKEILRGQPDHALETLRSAEPNPNIHLLKALASLTAGDRDTARSTLTKITPPTAQSRSLESIFHLVKHDQDKARKAIESALAIDSQSAEPWLAKSYIQQSEFDISGALVSAKMAENHSPKSALVKARLSELQLMNGDSSRALTSAKESVDLSSDLDLSHIAYGYALLQNRKPKQASKAFERAISLNPQSPKAKLGLGLSLIKLGEPEEGRQWLESATLSAPTDSLLRSYLGKTYFEENRFELAHDQLELAKQFGPKDPTPWFYESVLLHNENRPVEALSSMEKSIELNDQRAVYRSRLLLDDDSAFRNAGLGSLYQQLGFEQLGTSLAADSLAEDPTNPAAHRLLANAYLGNHRQNVARVNEMYQAQLFGEIGQQIIQPQLLRAHISLLDNGGPGSLGYNEYNTLLKSKGAYLNLSGTIADNNTWGNDLTSGYIDENYALHFGQYHNETDGFGTSNSYEEDSGAFQLQWQMNRTARLEIDAGTDKTERESAGLRFSDDFINPTRKTRSEYDKVGANLIMEISPADKLILRTSKTDGEVRTTYQQENFPGFPYGYDIPIDIEHKRDHIQYSHARNNHSILMGAQRTRKDNKSVHKLYELFDNCDFPNCYYEHSGESEAEDRRYYGYWYANQPEHGLTITTGIEVVRRFKDEDDRTERSILPKFGIGLQATEQTRVNLALFKALSSAIDANLYETLAPTQIAGFNQIFTGQENAPSDNYGVSLEHRFTPNLRSGIRYTYHKDTAVLGQLSFTTDGFEYVYQDSDTRIEQASVWLYWTPNNQVGVSLEVLDERFEDEQEQLFNQTSDNVESLDTTKVPIAFNYHHPSGFSTNITATYIQQKGKLWLNSTAVRDDTPIFADENVVLTDLVASYRLPMRRGSLAIGVKNAFNEQFKFEDAGSYNPLAPQDTGVPSIYAPERFWFFNASISF